MLTIPTPSPPASKLTLGGLRGSCRALAIATLAEQSQHPLLVITEDARESERLEHELAFFTHQPVVVFWDTETLPYDPFSPAQEITSKRLKALSTISQLTRGVIIASLDGLALRLPPKSFLTARSLELRVNAHLHMNDFRQQLSDAGYANVTQVGTPGEFAVRGSIVDLWPMGNAHPVRIDLFDEQIESLRYFDPDSQRSLESITELVCLPGREFAFDAEAIKSFRLGYRERFEGDVNRSVIYTQISKGLSVGGIEYYLPLWFDELASFFDYCPAATIPVRLTANLSEKVQQMGQDIQERYEQRRYDIERPLLSPAEVFLTTDELLDGLRLDQGIDCHTHADEVQIAHTDSFSQILGCELLPDLKRSAQADNPFFKLAHWIADHPQLKILLVAESTGRRESLLDALKTSDLLPVWSERWSDFLHNPSRLQITVATDLSSFFLPSERIAIVTEERLTGERASQRRRRRAERDPQAILTDLRDLAIDAPVVHEDHGVGRYQGLTTLDIDGHPHEFLIIRYAGDDKLYVPITALGRVSRYTGAQPESAPLHKLGGSEWGRARRKAAERIRDVAAELLDLYAKRAAKHGEPLSISDHELLTFADSFPFEETPDQSDAIHAVLRDLADPKPMDRVICGDVGFGKTEVALRAAFVAANAGKQVAVLVPTTLLAQQHYQNFSDRFADWPIRIQSLSRFRSKAETTDILQGLQDGSVDVVIATHRLLSQGVRFKRLGLVIVDEEHRFGVRDKERLKTLKTDVDMLTLTATPIPRTLNMALGGLRDLSLITTAPSQRLAVKTFVLEWHAATVREAILRELKRGGQVYFVHNAVESIESRAQELRALVPDADIRVGHGQMRERDLEQLMLDFYLRRFNVLVSTTIIESGIDVPTANTILIDRADRFGLAQLHQMRGRVGRSHHRAYAYLLTPPKTALTADAVKRLEAIESLEELGAGFTLATHDLEIRGAGELLGDQQSGQMTEIGFNLFSDLLQKAVDALKQGQESDLEGPLHKGADINLQVPALIPEDYLPDVHLRLSLYKRLALTQSAEDRDDFKSELIDRFGPLPEAVNNLLIITSLKTRADHLGIVRLDISKAGGVIEFSTQHRVDPARVIKLIQTQPNRYRLEGAHKIRLTHKAETPASRIALAEEYLKYFEYP